MIAEVYPIMRMPRKFGVFDYEIPEGISVSRGAFVRVPFRFGETTAVVARVKDGGGRGMKLKAVAGVLSDCVPMADRELSALEAVAVDCAQSVSALLHASVPPLVVRSTRRTRPAVDLDGAPLTIPAREAPSITHAAGQFGTRRRAFVRMPDLRRAAAFVATYLREHPDEPAMVLLPNVRDVRLAASRLSGFSPLVVTGEETPRERSDAWSAWRDGDRRVLVGTRTACMWTHPALGAIFLLRSSHANHKQDGRNPRFDARAVAEILGDALHARVARVDVAPRTQDLYEISNADHIGPVTRPDTLVADMDLERAGAPHPRLGASAVLAIERALSERRQVLCVYNLKGVSRRLQCADCDHRFPCPGCGGIFAPYGQTVRCHRCLRIEPIPLACPSCGGDRLNARGHGNRSVAAAIQTLFPEASVRISEKGSDDRGAATADILVVTRHYLENVFDPFVPPNVGLVADLDGDLSLYEPSSEAVEHAVLNAEEWRGVANACRAQYLVQTSVPELFRSVNSDPGRVLADDLETRRAYALPPFRRLMTVRHRAVEPRERGVALQALAEQLRQSVPEAEVTVGEEDLRVVSEPSGLLAILSLFGRLDDRYVVDTRPLA